MKVCSNGHVEIIHNSFYQCPLCLLIKHNSQVHDFIESKGKKFVDELVEYQKDKQRDINIYNQP